MALGTSSAKLEQGLRRAIDERQLRVHYQPVVDLHTGAVTGVEALVRWKHPNRGLLAPDVFLAMAEESGLVVPLGGWVLGEAVHLLSWASLAGGLGVGVNVSQRQLEDPDFAAAVAALLRGHSEVAALLELEVPWSPDPALQQLVRSAVGPLADAGVTLVADLAGPLEDVPGDLHCAAVKVPVRELSVSPVDRAHLRHLVMVAKSVEHDADLVRARTAGCDRGQGYRFASPVPAQRLPALLESTLL